MLRPLGRLEEAIAAARKAAALDPLNGRDWTALGSLLLGAGHLKEAREALDRSLEVNPEQAMAPSWLAVLLLVERQPAAALQAAQRSTAESFRLMGAALAQHDLGRAEESQRALDELIAKHAADAAYQIASVYAWRRENDPALEWLERAYAQSDGGLTLIKMDPMLRGLRGDPKFAAFLKKMNVPPD